jgi:hypothetical protein
MNTNSDRQATQLYVESKIGCEDASDLTSKETEFQAFKILHQDVDDIRLAVSTDSAALFRKGIQTLLQALMGLDRGQESWSLIRLYYATYFLLRSCLAAENIAIIRCKNIYTLDCKVGEGPVKRGGQRFRSDHVATISLYRDIFELRDILLSQHISQASPYDWLRDKREWINYRRREFIDVTGVTGFSAKEISYPKQVKLYCDDDVPIYCFDPDFAALALPVKKAQLTVRERGDGVEVLNNCFEELKRAAGSSKSCSTFVKALL